MRIMVIGSGGREHTLVWKLAQDKSVKKIYCAPGNIGMTEAELVPISATDKVGLLNFAIERKIDLTVVGPEAPLVDGISDYFQSERKLIFGPTAFAARLEGSKAFAKEFMERHGIPTAEYKTFTDIELAKEFVRERGAPLVVKASGLAAGKGAIVCNTTEEVYAVLESMMIERKFGDAGDKVVIEEELKGEEASILAVSDGKRMILLPSSQDHKRVYDDDEGPNTGGMGAYSPAPVVDGNVLERIESEIMAPTIGGIAEEGHPFKGVLYAGLMITEDGPKVIEFNVRFGDPEAQAVIPLLGDNFAELLLASAEGDLSGYTPGMRERSAACIVLASGGYPGDYRKGFPISGLDDISDEDVTVFHAGTASEGNRIVTNGGRVLGVTAVKSDLDSAIEAAYQAVKMIRFEGMHFRKDIGRKGLIRIRGEQV